jgi:hypothetical protein
MRRKCLWWNYYVGANPDDLGVGRSVVTSGGAFDTVFDLFRFHSASMGVSRWAPSSCHALVVGVEVRGFDLPVRLLEVSDELECGGVSEPNRVVVELVDASAVNGGDE